MTGFPFPSSSNKWTGVAEAKHPLIQDLIKLWEESPGYILPQESFIKDRAKLESLIDSLVELQKQKAQMPAKAALPKPTIVSNESKVEAASKVEDANWEKNLASALVMSKVHTTTKAESKVSVPIALPTELTLDPKLKDKLAELQKVEPLRAQKAEAPKAKNIHLVILYAISLSAFILASIALTRR